MIFLIFGPRRQTTQSPEWPSRNANIHPKPVDGKQRAIDFLVTLTLPKLVALRGKVTSKTSHLTCISTII